MSFNSGRRAPSVSEIAATNLFLRKISNMPSLESARGFALGGAKLPPLVGLPISWKGDLTLFSISVLTVLESHRAHQPARMRGGYYLL